MKKNVVAEKTNHQNEINSRSDTPEESMSVKKQKSKKNSKGSKE